MIERHIVNIGLPRTGTTWLWQHCEFEPRQDKENTILTTTIDFVHYENHYKQFTISGNFQTNLWQVDREIISFVQQKASHISMIVRNPFDFVARYFDWIYRGQDAAILVDWIVYSGFVRYADIVNRWSSGNAHFQVFLFEDLEHNPEQFFLDYMKFCQIPVVKNKKINYNTKVNVNPKANKVVINFSKDHINFINDQIDRFQITIDKNISHWKK